MSDAYTPIRGKCTWWREQPSEDDRWDMRIKDDMKRVHCTCFVEGKGWTFVKCEVPSDCPDGRHCRYYIRHS